MRVLESLIIQQPAGKCRFISFYLLSLHRCCIHTVASPSCINVEQRTFRRLQGQPVGGGSHELQVFLCVCVSFHINYLLGGVVILHFVGGVPSVGAGAAAALCSNCVNEG